MANPFATEEMAAGYATSRPAVHPEILKQALSEARYRRALDVGCGAGVSTKALKGFATECIGIEPSTDMLRWARDTAPFASFLAGTAEAIPLRDGSVDLITAAGSLNYADLDRFFPEASRVLAPEGVLLVYDFGPGVRFRNGSGLKEWFSGFSQRFPAPAHEARELSPEILAQWKSGFTMREAQWIDVVLRLTPEFYLRYMLTETNVAAAVRNGESLGDIEHWCAKSLAPVWRSEEREVVFRGYFAKMVRSVDVG